MVIDIIAYYFIASFIIALVGSVIKLIIEEVKHYKSTRKITSKVTQIIEEDRASLLMEQNLQKLIELRDKML